MMGTQGVPDRFQLLSLSHEDLKYTYIIWWGVLFVCPELCFSVFVYSPLAFRAMCVEPGVKSQVRRVRCEELGVKSGVMESQV